VSVMGRWRVRFVKRLWGGPATTTDRGARDEYYDSKGRERERLCGGSPFFCALVHPPSQTVTDYDRCHSDIGIGKRMRADRHWVCSVSLSLTSWQVHPSRPPASSIRALLPGALRSPKNTQRTRSSYELLPYRYLLVCLKMTHIPLNYYSVLRVML